MKKSKPLDQLVVELRSFFDSKGLVSSTDIAKVTGINQSQVYRNLFGRPKRCTKTHESLCEYAKIKVEIDTADPRNNPTLMNALALVWDGSDDHAQRLARLLFAHQQAAMGKWIKANRGTRRKYGKR